MQPLPNKITIPTMWPITLTEPNLGKRQLRLNSMVNEAYENSISFAEIQNLPEKSPVDRLFKIDMASKLRNVDFIIQNLRDEDMLYVSRALKSKWLLDPAHEAMMTPQWLEDELFPTMFTTAVSKMKNWLYLNLKDELRCQKFYQFYKEKEFRYAMKFFVHCSQDYINSEVREILGRLSPQHFKILCEKCPQVAEMYFNEVHSDDEILTKFLDNQQAYYIGLKGILKQDPTTFFKISEEIFEKKYNPSLTRYIMKHHRDKFNRKPELYAALLLHTKTLAQCLSAEECKQLVLRLARANYLSYWFTYSNVEPLIKRLKPEERASFKKQVFVNKDVGTIVEEWPYKVPTIPKQTHDSGNHVFDDEILSTLAEISYKKCFLSSKCRMECAAMQCMPIRTYLDQLFDEYRFTGFSKTFYEISKRIKSESTYKNREYMMLVLVSKTGGKPECVASLLELLRQHSNEPANLKAAVVRSLVKRAAVWRLPQDTWETLMVFAQGLGLNGGPAEAECHEGLHAVVMRQLLDSGDVEAPVREAFLKNFSLFDQYSMNADERQVIKERLPNLLLAAVDAEPDPQVRAGRLCLLLDTLQTYKVPVETTALIPAVTHLAELDSSSAEGILRRLFDAKIARRMLFRENFTLIQTDESYLNALRHDTSVLDVNKFVELIERKKMRPEKFLRKLSIYFTERGGLADVYLASLRGRVVANPEVKQSLARPLCILQGADLTFLRGLDTSQKHTARLAATVRCNMHVGRRKLRLDETSLTEIGPKAAANKLLSCPASQVDSNVRLLLQCPRTVRLALILAERIDKEFEAFVTASFLRPASIVMSAIKYFKRAGSSVDIRVWTTVKPIIEKTDFSKYVRRSPHEFIADIKFIPPKIQPEYFVTIIQTLKMLNYLPALSHMYSLVLNLNQNFVDHTLLEFLDRFSCVSSKDTERKLKVTKRYIRILMKYLLMCKSEEIQKERFEKLGYPFLKCLESVNREHEDVIFDYIGVMLTCIRCNEIFDPSYVSPLPILDKIISWMNLTFPIEKHLKWHLSLHLTKSFYRAVKQSVVDAPCVFEDEKRKRTEGVDLVGRLFGRLIAADIEEMTSKYFDSFAILYQQLLIEYYSDQFEYSKSLTEFMISVMKGISETNRTGGVVALRFYNDIRLRYCIEEDINAHILNDFKLKNDNEINFFMFGECYTSF
ncbi:uncharacterized protein LOC101743491 isoform X2 [Bombyx mori]|uniref:uncharacterized protein LOC101743491 isoform X2 n=1 Tax=Bombyx mori TaxID=7091 RepID=UPI002ED20420